MQHGCEKDQHYIEIMDRFDPFPFFDHLIRFVGFIWFYDVIPVISLLSTYKKKPMIYPISPFVSHSYIPWNSMKPTVFWAQILFRTSPSGSYWSKTCRWWDNIDHIKHPPWHEYIPYDIFWGVEYTYIYICIHIYIYMLRNPPFLKPKNHIDALVVTEMSHYLTPFTDSIFYHDIPVGNWWPMVFSSPPVL
jgi:hypothetical protein